MLDILGKEISRTPLKKSGDKFVYTRTLEYTLTEAQVEELRVTAKKQKEAEQQRDSVAIIAQADSKIAEVNAVKPE